jgi:amino acid permease
MYLVNLISGLVLAEVAIQQRQASGKEAPSSFKAFAEASIESPMAKDIIAAVSVMKNALVLAFGTMKAGILGNELFGLDPNAASIVWAVAFSALMGTQSSPNLSKVASIFVFGLFVSFAAILVPGLEQIPDPMAVFAMPGTSPDIWGSMMQALPIILMSFIFQNIVPTTARILDYDRIKIAIAVSMGTLFPYCMYSAWCLAVLGGGVDTSVGLDGPLFTIFSIVTIAGSHLGSSTSMAEELDTYLRPSKDDDEDRKNQVFSLRSVGITAVLAIGLGEGFANHLNDLLSLAGAYGSPFLYFVLPVAMAYNQSRKQAASRESSFPPQETSKDFTVSSATIPLAITAATGLVGSEVLRLL